MSAVPLLAWSEMFPDGRDIYYEGDDPDGFVAEIKDKYGFDPSARPHKFGFGTPDGPPSSNPGAGVTAPYWGEIIDPAADGGCGIPFASYPFHCPAEHLNAIYGGDYPLGS